MTEAESRTSALSFRSFRLFMSMRLPAALAAQMQSVAAGWMVYDISHDPLSLMWLFPRLRHVDRLEDVEMS